MCDGILLKECAVPLQDDKKHLVLCQEDPFDIYFYDLCYSVKETKGKWKEILHSISGEFRSNRLTAVLGPSGAGKTSLLNVISGRIRKQQTLVEGTIATSNHKSPDYFRKRICYVSQECALLPLLTTRETLCIAARLKLSSKNHDCTTRNSVIQRVTEMLNLEECMNTLVQHLSGGEKKRLSIAVETITSPSIMLLDEPTSGLDSASSAQVIDLLYSIAQNGCNVVCNIHQPSSQMMSKFDDVLILSQGCCRYSGPREDIIEHFKNAGFICPSYYNVAEFVIEVVTGQRSGNYQALKSDKCYNKDNIANENYIEKQSSQTTLSTADSNTPTDSQRVLNWEHLKVLLYRALVTISRDKTLTNLRFATHVFVALLLGLVFYDFGQSGDKTLSNVSCLFFFCLFLFFANAMPNVQMFPVETAVFLREHSNNWYSLGTYYVTKMIADVPLQIVCPTTFLVITYYLTGQPLEVDRFSKTWLISLLLTVLSQSFGIAIGAAFNVHAGMFLAPAINIPIFLFAGFFLRLNEIPWYLRFLSDISYFRYAFEGIIQAVYLDRGEFACDSFCFFSDSETILSQLDMPSVSFYTIVIALILWIIILNALIYGILKLKLYMAKK